MSNCNSRSHLILKLAKETIALQDNIKTSSKNHNDEWKIVVEEETADTTPVIALNPEKIDDECYDANSQQISAVLEVEPQPIESNTVQSFEEVQPITDFEFQDNQDSSKTIPESVDEGDPSLSDPYSTDDSNADPDYMSDGKSSTSSIGSTTLNVKPSTSCNKRKTKEKQPSEIQIKKRKVMNFTQEEKNGKKRISAPQRWIKNRAKALRNTGESYLSVSKGKKVIAARTLLPPCTDKCKLKCYSKFVEEDRKQIFNDYWKLADLEKQRHFISASMTTVTPKYKYVRENSHRRPNNAFHFEIRDKKIHVCKEFFKATLCITDRPIRTVIAKRNLFTGQMLSSDLRGKHGCHFKVDNEIKNGIRQHIMKIPRIESHYCRSHTEKEYIEGGKTIADLHRDYVKDCAEQNKPSGNYMMYCRIFNEEYNLSFFVPKKDQCEVCVGYMNASEDEKSRLQEYYDTHRLETELSRKEKDKTSADGNNIVAVYDLQAVLPCPSGEASSFYYVSKLNVLNLTICNIKTKDVQCYVWHDGEAQRGVNEIGTCVLRYLESIQQNIIDNNTENSFENNQIARKNIIFFSDNCAGQQKNRFMIAAYMYAVQHFDFLESITHKYLITGHTQNEGDNAHSLIERQIKRSKRSGPVYIPDQYVTLIRSAKKSGQPYKVDELCHKDIFDVKQLASDFGLHSFPKNANGETVKISEVKVIKVMKDSPGTLLYKTSYQQEEFQIMTIKRRKKNNNNVQLKNVYTRKVGIAEKKKSGLLALFKRKFKPIPSSYLPFFEAL